MGEFQDVSMKRSLAGEKSAGGPSASPMVILFFVAAIYLVSYMSRQIFALLLPEINRDIRMTDTQIGQLTGLAFPVIYGVTSLFVAVAADRLNRVKLMAYSTAFFSVMTFACGLAQGFPVMFMARLGVGLGEAGPTPPSLSLLADSFVGPARQFANSVYTAAAVFGMLVAYVVIGNLSATYGWRAGFQVAGAFGLVVAVATLLCLRDPARTVAHAPMSIADIKRIPELFRIPSFSFAVAAAVFNTVLTESSLQWLPLFLSRSLHMSQVRISWFLGLNYSILGLMGILGGALISARLRRRSVGAPQIFCAVVVGLITLGYILVCVSPSLLVSEVALAFVIFLTISAYGALLAFVQDVTPDDGHAKATALLFFLMQIGFGLGSFLIGVLSDFLRPQLGTESLRYALLPVVAISGISAATCYIFASRHGDRDANNVLRARQHRS
jgi:predicted MFS family arabinose efflux permease